MAKSDWTVEISRLQKGREPFDAALFSISNGYVGTRGTDEETYAGAPRTFVAGLFNPDPLGMETMASVHNWLATRLFVDDDQFFYEVGKILKYRKTLDMKHACVMKRVETINRAGKKTRIESLRFVSMDDQHILGLRYSVTPLNYSGRIRIQSGLDMRIASSGCEHFEEIGKGHRRDVLYNTVKANRSDTVVGMAASITADCDHDEEIIETELQSWKEISFQAREGKTYSVDKIVSVYTSRDSKGPAMDAMASILRNSKIGLEELYQKHSEAWIRLWKKHDIIIKGDALAQHSIRFAIYQLLSAAPRMTEDANIGAKALTGDRYRGHIFWDTEIYLQQFYNLTSAEFARHLLMYRYNRLAPAKEKAKRLGARGACFVWESADTGKESVPKHWLFPETGEVEPLGFADEEIHTSLDIAYAAWHYYASTGDEKFFMKYGLRLMLESALFYSTLATHNRKTGKYEINKVTGPDEHHCGVNNSAYINTMAKWNIDTVLDLLAEYRKTSPKYVESLLSKTRIADKDIKLMQRVSKKIKINFNRKTKMIEEFDSFFSLKDLYRDTPDVVPGEKPGAQLVKQADVVLLMVLLNDSYDLETKKKNYEYYEPHTEHESSLSASTHAVLAAEIGKVNEAYDFFIESSRIDIKSEKPDCIEGIHIGSCGGAWQAVIFGFAGLKITKDGLSLAPRLPKKWKLLSFRITYRNNEIEFIITNSEIVIHTSSEIEITIAGKSNLLRNGKNILPLSSLSGDTIPK